MGVEQVGVRQRGQVDLKRQSRDAAQHLVMVTNFVDHLVRTAEDHGPRRSALGIELGAADRTPPPLFADPGHALQVAGRKLVNGLLERRRDVAERMHADLQLIGRVASPSSGLAVEVDQGSESTRIAADDRDHQRQAQRTSTGE